MTDIDTENTVDFIRDLLDDYGIEVPVVIVDPADGRTWNVGQVSTLTYDGVKAVTIELGAPVQYEPQ